MSKPNQPQTVPQRGAQHDALEVFLGSWKAEGWSFGGSDHDARNPRENPTRWTSTHSARWHPGNFFLIQDERAQVDSPFDTLSIMGWDDDVGRYFARTFENHGFYRHYDLTVEGNVWTISGKPSRGSGGRKTSGCHSVIALRRSCDARPSVAADVPQAARR